jgi:hypothetical protein
MSCDLSGEVDCDVAHVAKGTKSPQFRHAHVILLFDVWVDHPPVGEKAQDRKMKAGGVDVTLWQPMVDRFNELLPEVNAKLIAANPRDKGKLLPAASVATLKQKWKKMQREYKAACRHVPFRIDY